MRYATALLVLAAVFLAALRPGPGEPPRAAAAFPGENGKIAFYQFSASGEGIYTVNADGGGEALLIADGAYPAWSPDGTRIALSRLPGANEIWTANADGSNQQMIATGNAPTWSPDGEQIAYMLNGGIARINLKTGTVSQVTTQSGGFSDLFPRWSPRGDKIAFYGGRGSTPDETDGTIWVVNADGTGLTQLTSGDLIDTGPAWSPDGSQIAFLAGQGSCVGLCVIDATGGGRRQVASSNTVGAVVAWSPDGQEIVFGNGVGDPLALQLFAVNVNDGGTRQLTTGPNPKVNPDWQPLTCPSLFDIPDNLQTVDDLDGDGIPNDIEEQETNTDPECPDTDSDGLLDPWEVPENVTGAGFDIDQDGTPDVTRDIVFGPYDGQCGPPSFGLRREPDGQNCSLVFEPDPLHKDMYIEIDWQDCALGSCPELVGVTADPSHHAPSMAGLQDVVNEFRHAPVENPDDSDGIDLRILVDEAIAHDHNCDQGAAETRPTNFGTVQQRTDPEVISAKEMVYRYAWSGHSSAKATPQDCPLPSFADVLLAGLGLTPLPEYDISPHGFATPGGRDILVTLAVTWVCQLYTFDSGPIVDYAPCFRSPAPFTGVAPGLFPAEIGPSHTHVSAPVHTLLGIPPSQGVRQVWGRAFMNLLGQSMGVPSSQVGNNPNTTGAHPPESYGVWRGLEYAPPAPGATTSAIAPLSADGFAPILPDFALAGEDADGDGAPEGEDNCPGIANPDQADLDGDVFGDACDNDADGDGVLDEDDAHPRDTDNDGTPNSNDGDDDDDGLLDIGDNCPLVANPGEANVDGDGEGDVCDPDADGDGLPNSLETTMGSDPLSEDEGPEFLGYENTCGDGLDNDGDGDTDSADDSCVDSDSDSVPDSLDNCPGVDSINLLDDDGDGEGNVCEPAGTDRIWGDVKCDNNVNLGDSIAVARALVSLDPGQSAGCPAMGAAVTVESAQRTWGDVDCSGALGLGDAIAIARFLVGLMPNVAGCPVLGTAVKVRT